MNANDNFICCQKIKNSHINKLLVNAVIVNLISQSEKLRNEKKTFKFLFCYLNNLRCQHLHLHLYPLILRLAQYL